MPPIRNPSRQRWSIAIFASERMHKRLNVATTRHLWQITAMKFQDLIAIVAEEPVFETGLLLAGPGDPAHVRRQLSRWVRAGRVQQLRRGLYALAPPWRKRIPHPFLVANRLAPDSYVSGLSALAFAHAIPEYVAEVTSVTARRPHVRKLPLGRYSFRHLKAGLLFGYRQVDLGEDQQAFVAAPEKALLDAVHLQPGGDDEAYLRELRLDFDVLCMDTLGAFAARCATPKLARAARHVRDLADRLPEYETL